MTWKELAAKISGMPGEEQNKEILLVGEDFNNPLSVSFIKSTGKLYYASNWDFCAFGSDMDQVDLKEAGLEILANEGSFFLHAKPIKKGKFKS